MNLEHSKEAAAVVKLLRASREGAQTARVYVMRCDRGCALVNVYRWRDQLLIETPGHRVSTGRRAESFAAAISPDFPVSFALTWELAYQCAHDSGTLIVDSAAVNLWRRKVRGAPTIVRRNR